MVAPQALTCGGELLNEDSMGLYHPDCMTVICPITDQILCYTSTLKKLGIFNQSRDHSRSKKVLLEQAGVVHNIKS